MESHHIVSGNEWLAARKALLAEEKALTHARDALLAKRRQLPWERVGTTYTFDTPQGRRTLADLFDGRSQLLVYHFMLGPDWSEGCVGCSFLSDHVDGMLPHLLHHDVSYVAVSRAPLEKIEAFKKRMGWRFPWVSSEGSDFNFDYHVSFSETDKARGKAVYNFEEQDYMSDELPGISAFYRDHQDEGGNVYHTYSAYARGLESLVGTYAILDMAAKGRNEADDLRDWVRHHDRYDAAPAHACHAHEKHETGAAGSA